MSLLAYFNPYSNADFIDFFFTLGKRVANFARGQLGIQDLAADEVQMIVLAGVAITTAIVGVFLVLRRMTMLANALSHTVLLGIVVAYLFTRQILVGGHESYGIDIETLLIASICSGLLTTFLSEFLSKTLKLQEDASIGLVFTTLFALGIILVTVFTRNSHIGVEVVMGNVDALRPEDMGLAWTAVGVNALLFFLFFKEYQLTTFDASLAKAMGISACFFNYLLMVQVSASSIAAFRAVGVLMVLAFMVGPVLTARLFTHSLKNLLLFSAAVGVLASLLGVALSRHLLTVYDLSFSTAGLVVCVIIILYVLALLFAPESGAVVQSVRRRRLRAAEREI